MMAINLMQDAPETSTQRRRRFSSVDLGLIALIAFAVLVLYWPVRTYSSVDLDDPQYVFENSTVLAGLNAQTFKWAFFSQTGGLWQPLTMLTFLCEVRLHGPQPGWMHLDNLFLHTLSSIGWYVLLRGITGRRGAAFFTAAIFSLHPARVESVAWITERKDVLSMLMVVLSLIAYWRFVRRSNPSAYIVSLLLFTLALMSKAMVVTQPCLMLLLDFWPLGRTWWCKPAVRELEQQSPVSPLRLLSEKIPFFALSALDSFIALKTQSEIGARPDLLRLPLGDRLATVVVGYVRYLGTEFVPRHLAVYYPYQLNLPPAVVLASVVLLLIITTIILRFWRGKPYILVGWIWFVLAMVPVSGLFQAGDQSMADRFTYLPSMGLTFAAVWFVNDTMDAKQITRVFATACGALVLIVCAALTRDYLSCWKDTISLFTRAAQANVQRDPTIELHLGDAYAKAHRPDLAIDHYEWAAELNPNNASTQINLANLLMQTPPDSPRAAYEYRAALWHYQYAIRLKPGSALAHYNCGVCLNTLHEDPEAAREFKIAEKLGH
jgi:protein O-mannosyl-transferase